MCPEQPNPTYGASAHYLSTRGEKYFAWQSKGGVRRGRINARKMARYILSHGTTLDFGCGDGSLLLHLPSEIKLGVEINQIARKACVANGIECFSRLDEVSDHSVDTVISNHALEHVPNPYEALVKMRSKLRSGGQIVLFLPFDDWRTQRRYMTDDINQHFYTWSPQQIGNLLSEAGFDHVGAGVYARIWPPFWEWFDQHLPDNGFELLCMLYAWVSGRRQVVATAFAKNSS